jgi:hypothetical protein
MNTNLVALLLLGGFGSIASKTASRDFCLHQQFQQKIRGHLALIPFRSQPTSTNDLRSSSPDPRASALARQTDSLGPRQFGYFPL